MEKPTFKICLLAPTDILTERARSIIAKEHIAAEVKKAALEEAVAYAKEMLAQGPCIFISRGGTYDLLQRHVSAPMVKIPNEASDYVPAFQKIHSQQGVIAFFSSEPVLSNELSAFCTLLKVQIRNYFFFDTQGCEAVVKQAIADGAVCGLGGGVSARFAEELGLPYIRVESSEASILHALETAEQMCQNILQSMRQQEELKIRLERFQNILDYTHDAVIAIDDQGKISVTNQLADQMLLPDQPPFEGQPIGKVLPNTRLPEVLRNGQPEIGQVMNIKGHLVSTNRVPIRVNGQIRGVVATFQDIKTLQNAERNARVKLHEKGLVAKYQFSDILGTSEEIVKAKRLAASFADSQFTVLLYGETGTGKEMFAQSIHNVSPRRDGPFVAINCTALNRDLLESELFGYVSGSFTGAQKGGKIGLFELANGGTIFLDEIGDLPRDFQAPLLRVLQEREVRRIGDDRVVPVDIRVITATNHNLLELVQQGKFRQDLYYRLNVLNVYVAPLRQRGSDYLQIARAFYRKIMPVQVEWEKDAFLRIMDKLRDYSWPGNIRELSNVVERVSLLLHHGSREEDVRSVLFKELYRHQQMRKDKEEGKETLAAKEPDWIITLRKNGGNMSRTAKELGISRSTLYRKLNEKEKMRKFVSKEQ